MPYELTHTTAAALPFLGHFSEPDTDVIIAPPRDSLEDHTRYRAALARLVAQADEAIAALAPHEPPFVVVRDDGAVYTGHPWAGGFRLDRAPKRFMYRAAAQKRADLAGAVVLPFAVWNAARLSLAPQVAVRAPEAAPTL